jgi:hypothetical protein
MNKEIARILAVRARKNDDGMKQRSPTPLPRTALLQAGPQGFVGCIAGKHPPGNGGGGDV